MTGEMATVGLGDALDLATRNNGNGGFGNGGTDAWVLIILFALIFGGGNFGGFGGNSGALTRAELWDSNALQTIQQNQTQNMRDMCQSTATLSNQIADASANTVLQMVNGFNNTNNGIANLGFEMQNCCCTTNRNIDGVNHNIQAQTTALMNNQNENTQKLLDKMCQQEINALKSENAQLRSDLQSVNLAYSQTRQNEYLVGALGPKAPIPAFSVAPPWYSGGYAYGNGGCGTCCNA